MNISWLRWLPYIVVFSLLGCALTGCISSKSPNTVEKSDSNVAQMTVEPVDLFAGDAAKFKPFLGSMSGAFKLRYKGQKPQASLDLDLWEDGKKTSAGSVGDFFFSTEDQTTGEIEVIIAIESLSDDEQGDRERIKLGVYHDSGSSLATFTLPLDQPMKGRGLMAAQLPQTFDFVQPVPIWGMQGTRSNQMQTADLSQASIQSLEWGLILTLRPES